MIQFPEFMPVPANGGFRMDNYWVWCGSAIEEPGKGFYLYASRWRNDYPMLEGYVLFSEIVLAFSENLTGPYRFVKKILPATAPSSWDGKMAHNPAVVRYKDEYLLFYIGSTYDEPPTPSDRIRGERAMMTRTYDRIRIGLARSKHPDGPWTVCPHPVLEARPGMWDGTIVTNPAPCVLPDGRIYLYYRTNTPAGLRIGLAVADVPEGPYRRFDCPVLEGANIEDPFVWHTGNCFEMLAKDMTGDLTGEFHAGAHFVSKDGIDWKCNGKAYSRHVVYDDGTEVTLGSLERPQLLFGNDGTPRALFAATADGPGGFDRAARTWNMVIPLRHSL